MPTAQVPEEAQVFVDQEERCYWPLLSLASLRWSPVWKEGWEHSITWHLTRGGSPLVAAVGVYLRVTVWTWTPVGLKKSGLDLHHEPHLLDRLWNPFLIGYFCWLHSVLFVQEEQKWNSLINLCPGRVKIVGLSRIKPKSSHPSTFFYVTLSDIRKSKNEHCKS